MHNPVQASLKILVWVNAGVLMCIHALYFLSFYPPKRGRVNKDISEEPRRGRVQKLARIQRLRHLQAAYLIPNDQTNPTTRRRIRTASLQARGKSCGLGF